jgi:hypothetical protein
LIASPFTVDILVELNNKFSSIVTEKLDKRSQEAIMNQEDPGTMTDYEQLKIRKSILHRVYGKLNYKKIGYHNIRQVSGWAPYCTYSARKD